MLSCTNLTCERGEKQLFSGLGATFMPGALVWIKGQNGSGKTSLIKILSGILKAKSGEIAWENNNILRHPQFLNELLYIGHLNALKAHLTVEENVSFWAKLRGTDNAVAAALHFFGLTERKNIPVNQLSAGWQRRTALSRLAAIPAPLWLLDEPATNLDEDGAERLATLIASRCQQGGIVIYTGHQPISTLKPNMTLDMEDWQ